MTRVAGGRAAAGGAPPRSRLDPRIGPMNLRPPPPAELAVALHPKVRVLDRGRVLVGGTPLRVLRLTAEGARAIAEWGAPSPVGDLPRAAPSPGGYSTLAFCCRTRRVRRRRPR
jgi:hypothetical protein